MFDNEHNEQEEFSLVYRFPRYDFLINRVQLKINFYLLLLLHLVAILVIKWLLTLSKDAYKSLQ